MKKYPCIIKITLVSLIVFSWMLPIASCYWKKIMVTFDYDYMEKQVVQEATDGFLTEPEIIDRIGYSFDGWYYKDKKWDFSKDVASENITLIAKWIPESYTLTLDANGGVCDIDFMTVYYEQPYNLPEVTKEGYYFAGWYVGSSHRLVKDEVWTYTSNKTYQAKWSILPEDITVKFGSYEQDNDYTNGAEPIDWLVIDEKDGKYLLISKFVLDGQHYNTLETKYNLWKDSYIRNWLNTYFLETAFNFDEQQAIAETHLEDVDTIDRVFFLNLDETRALLLNDSWWLGECTTYALSLGLQLNVSNEQYKSWHLRDAGGRGHFLSAASLGGFCSSGVGRGLEGCRPVIWVNKDAVLLN